MYNILVGQRSFLERLIILMFLAHQHNKAYEELFPDVRKELPVWTDINFGELRWWEAGNRREGLEEGEVCCGGILRWTRHGKR